MQKQREHFSATIIKCSWKYHFQRHHSSPQIPENEDTLIQATQDVFDSIDTMSSERRSSAAQVTEVQPAKDGLESIYFMDLDSNLEKTNSLSQVSVRSVLEAHIRDEQV